MVAPARTSMAATSAVITTGTATDAVWAAGVSPSHCSRTGGRRPGKSGRSHRQEEAFMSTITTQELELETAELLPARETLWGSFSYQSNSAVVGNGNGDTYQSGLINVSLLNGNFNGDFNNIGQSNS